MRYLGLMAAAAVAFGPFLGGATVIPETAIYGAWTAASEMTYTLKDGSPAVLTNGSDLVLTSVWTGNTGPTWTWNLHSLTFDAPLQSNFWLDGGYYNLGAGGITFLQNTLFSVGRSSPTDRRVKLTADQTWSGTGTETDPRATLSFGYCDLSGYYAMTLAVDPDVHALTLAHNLDLWLCGRNTQLGDVDVTVETPARLILPASLKNGYGTYEPDACLAARKLTLRGDGASALPLGTEQTYPSTYKRKATTITAIDAFHLAPTLELADGADLVASVPALFAVPDLRVTGDVNDASVVSGEIVVTQALTSVTLEGGATLDFADAALSETGVVAGWSFSGAGVVRLGELMTTGPVEVNEGVSVLFAASADLFDRVLTGNGEIVVDPGEGREILLGDLSRFAGTVRIKSGVVVPILGWGSATPVLDGGRAKESGGLVVTDSIRADEELTVVAGETLEVYGNGLTAATRLVLDGGRVLFRRTARLSSPVTVTRTSKFDSGDVASTTGEVAAAVSCAITNAVEGGLQVHGFGTVVFSGGATFELPGPEWWNKTTYNTFGVYGGTAILTNGLYDLGCGKLTIGTTNVAADVGGNAEKQEMARNWGKRLIVRDGGSIVFADRGSGAGSATVVMDVQPPMDSSQYCRTTSTVEVATGGSLTIPWNRHVRFGNNQNVGELLISGGNVTLNPYGGFYLGQGGFTTGTLTMEGGQLTLHRPLGRGDRYGQSRLIWNGGTIKLGRNYYCPEPVALFTALISSATNSGLLKASVQVNGTCKLDLSECPYASFMNMPPNLDRAEWVGTGTLEIVGGTTCKEIVMNDFPGGAKLVLKNGIRVTVPAGARVYDPEKSSTLWVKPWPESNFTPTDSWLSTDGVHLAELAVAGTNVVFADEIVGHANTIGTLRVTEGGVWNTVGIFDGVAETEITNAVFEAGAQWNVTTEASLDLLGSLSLSESLLLNAVPGAPVSMTLAHAEDGVTGAPEWIMVGRKRQVTVGANEVNISGLGAILIVR